MNDKQPLSPLTSGTKHGTPDALQDSSYTSPVDALVEDKRPASLLELSLPAVFVFFYLLWKRRK